MKKRGSLLTLIVCWASVWVLAADQAALRAKAEAGDAQAQYELGTMYSTGNGVPHDPDAAITWYKLAATKGHAKALYNLGVAYYNGKTLGAHISPDPELAWAYFTLAADRGDAQAKTEAERVSSEIGKAGLADAEFRLSDMLRRGGGIPKNVPRAVELLKQAGETGSPRAQSELVKLYETGSDVPVNGKEAIYWQEKLAQNSPLDPQPRIHLAEMYLDPKLGGPNLDAATDACKQFINTTIRNTCLALVEERRPNPDYRKAAAWFKAGAEALNFTAVEHYAHLLAAGKGVKQDDVKAYYWLRVLQELGYRAHAEDLMDDVSKKLTPAERAKQDKEVAKLRIVPGQH